MLSVYGGCSFGGLGWCSWRGCVCRGCCSLSMCVCVTCWYFYFHLCIYVYLFVSYRHAPAWSEYRWSATIAGVSRRVHIPQSQPPFISSHICMLSVYGGCSFGGLGWCSWRVCVWRGCCSRSVCVCDLLIFSFLFLYMYICMPFLCPTGTLPLGLSTDEARRLLAPLSSHICIYVWIGTLPLGLSTDEARRLLAPLSSHVSIYVCLFLSYRHAPAWSEHGWSEAITGSIIFLCMHICMNRHAPTWSEYRWSEAIASSISLYTHMWDRVYMI